MANYFAGNLQFIDTNGTIFSDELVKVSYIIVHATSATGTMTLQDGSTSNTLIKLGAPVSKDTLMMDFSERPIVFPRGITIADASNLAVTLIIRRDG